MEMLDNKYVQSALGALVGSLGTIFVFKKRLADIEEDHKTFRRETREMFTEIRKDIKVLLSRRRDDRDYVSRLMDDQD